MPRIPDNEIERPKNEVSRGACPGLVRANAKDQPAVVFNAAHQQVTVAPTPAKPACWPWQPAPLTRPSSASTARRSSPR